MGYRLKNRNKPIPGGMTWRDPGTGYQAPPFSSFSLQVQGVLQARIASPTFTKRYHLSTDQSVIEQEVDSGLATIAAENGWTDYYVTSAQDRAAGGGPAPFPVRPRSLKREVAGLAAGGSILVKWIKSGAEAVPQAVSDNRASVCAECPLNDKGDWTRFFTVPVSGAIRRELERRKEFKLSTPYDDKLQICAACICPLKLKVHLPFEFFWPEMDDETKVELWEGCWIRKEAAEHKVT
jgi:hypothetical protein